MEKQNKIFNFCIMPARLEITYNPEQKLVSLSRCCYIPPFADIKLNDFFKIKDVIKYAEEKSKLVKPIKSPAYAEWCASKCNIEEKIKIVTVSFSKACNLNCYHCFFNYHEDEPYIKRVQFKALNLIKHHQIEKLHLISSGEVFFYYDELIGYLKSLTTDDFKEIDFQSNITLLNKERINELKRISEKTGIKYLFSASIDGITKETFEAVRIGANWEHVLENLKCLCKVFSADNIYINFTLKRPAFSDLPNVNSFFHSIGIDHIQITPDIFDKEASKLLNSL